MLALAFSLLVGAGAVGQDSSSTVRETAEAVLVEVPVRVTGRDGIPLRNLTAADFQLYDDGKKQEIVGFDAIDLAGRGTSISGQDRNPAARRRFLLLFDLSFSRPKALLEARGAAQEFVVSGMGDEDLAAVATFSLDSGLRLILNFSSDRIQLARAIQTLGLATSLAKEKDPLELVYDVSVLQRMSGSGATGRLGFLTDSALIESLETFKALGRAAQDRYARARIGGLFNSFTRLAQALDLVAGRKDVIYLSEGFESRLLVGTRETEQEKEWITTGDQWKIDSDRRFGNSAMQTQLDEMTSLFRRSDCVIHAVDIAGLQADADVGFLPVRGENALFEIANGTGGEVLRNGNDFRAQLGRLIARTNLVYVLAFRPTQSGKSDRFHELKVKVRASGARVSARPGYYERKAFRALTPLERSLSAADVIANEIPISDIPLRLLAAPVPGPRGLASVPVLVEIPGDRFLIQQSGLRASAEIYVYAHDFQNHLLDFFAQTISVDLTLNRARLAGGTLRYFGQLSLAPGQYRLRALVRNGETGRMGLAAQSLRVPDFSENKPYLAPPLFLESSGDGIFVRGPSGVRGGGVPAGDELLMPAQRENLVPAALPLVQSGTPSRLSVVAYHFSDFPGDSLRIGAQVLSEEGRPLQEGSIAVLGRSRADAEGRQSLLVAFTPEGLSPGLYALRVIVQDSATGEGRHASAPFMVR